MPKTELRYVAACGMLGSGFRETSLRAGVQRRPAFIGCDAGSNDDGPSGLATGGLGCFLGAVEGARLPSGSRGRNELEIPLIIGSCGGSGLDRGVDQMAEWTDQIAKKRGVLCRVAKIYSEPPRELLKARYRTGKVMPLFGARPIDESTFDKSLSITAMMGAEALQVALSERGRT